MPINMQCERCGRRFTVPDERAGQRGKCPCGAIMVVPAGRKNVPRPTAPQPTVSKKTVACPSCGAANPPGYVSCSMCGAVVAREGITRPAAAPRREKEQRKPRPVLIIVPAVVVFLLVIATAYWTIMVRGPRLVVQRYLEAAKTLKPEDQKPFVTKASAAQLDSQAAAMAQFSKMMNDQNMSQFMQQIKKMMSEMTFEITKISVHGKTATVQYKTHWKGMDMMGMFGVMGSGFGGQQILHLALEGLRWKVDLIKTQKEQMARFRKQFRNWSPSPMSTPPSR